MNGDWEDQKRLSRGPGAAGEGVAAEGTGAAGEGVAAGETCPGAKRARLQAGRALRLLLAALAAGCLAYFFGLGIYLSFGNGFLYLWLILAAAFGGLALLWPSLGRLGRPLRLALGAAALCGLAVFLCLEGAIIAAASGDAQPGADYVIVLGAKVNGQTPSLTLRRRIEGAAGYLLANPQTLAVVSGGQGADEEISEAQAMARGLLALGISGDRIILEDQSTSTEENLRFSLRWVSEESRVVIVSSDFHLFRAKALAKSLGYQNVTGLGTPSLPGLLPNYYLRELCGVLSAWVLGWTSP